MGDDNRDCRVAVDHDDDFGPRSSPFEIRPVIQMDRITGSRPDIATRSMRSKEFRTATTNDRCASH